MLQHTLTSWFWKIQLKNKIFIFLYPHHPSISHSSGSRLKDLREIRLKYVLKQNKIFSTLLWSSLRDFIKIAIELQKSFDKLQKLQFWWEQKHDKIKMRPQGKTFFLNWDSLHTRLNSHYKTWSYKKKEHKSQKEQKSF